MECEAAALRWCDEAVVEYEAAVECEAAVERGETAVVECGVARPVLSAVQGRRITWGRWFGSANKNPETKSRDVSALPLGECKYRGDCF